MEVKETALCQTHIALGAKMVPFAGFNMPVMYSGINDEHHSVRNGVGLFDVSHMGEFILEGENALELIQRLCTNDASRLKEGGVQYSCMTNPEGGIIDDLLVYCLGFEKYMLVVNASNIEKDWAWIIANNHKNVNVRDISEETALLALQGPKAAEVLQSICEIPLSGMKYYTFTTGSIAGIEDVIISATGYTGAGGFELYCRSEQAPELWDVLMKAGEPFGIKPAGLGARDTLRLEMGYCLYGNDIDDGTTPLEAGLGWITRFNNEFTASPVLLKQKEDGCSRKLCGFEMVGKGIPRKGYPILNQMGEEIGEVRSGTQSPSLGKAIGMGYIYAAYSQEDMPVFISIRDSAVEAKISKLPFFSSK